MRDDVTLLCRLSLAGHTHKMIPEEVEMSIFVSSCYWANVPVYYVCMGGIVKIVAADGLALCVVDTEHTVTHC